MSIQENVLLKTPYFAGSLRCFNRRVVFKVTWHLAAVLHVFEIARKAYIMEPSNCGECFALIIHYLLLSMLKPA